MAETKIDGRKILDHAQKELIRLAEQNEARAHSNRVAIIEEIFRDVLPLLEPFYVAEVGSGEVLASDISIPPPLRVRVRPELNAAAHVVARAAVRFYADDLSETDSKAVLLREATEEYRRLLG